MILISENSVDELFGYGIGRFWIEGLRTDQLLLPVVNYPVSQLVAILLVVISLVWVIVGEVRARKQNPSLSTTE